MTEVTSNQVAAASEAWKQLSTTYEIKANPRIEPLVTMTATDDWMRFSVRYPVDYKQRRIMKDRIFTRLLQELEATHGRVGIASSTFQVVAPSVLDVNVRNDSATK